jgi:hypothetical protein
VMARQGDEGDRERSSGQRWGVRVCFPLFFHVSRPGSGQGRLGIDKGVRGDVLRYGYGARAYWNGVIHSGFDFPDFCTQRVRHNARKSLNFEFLKNSTLGCHHI